MNKTGYHNGAICKEPIARELDWSKEDFEIFEWNYWFCTHLWRTGGIGSQSSPNMWMQMVEQTHTINILVVMCLQLLGEPFCGVQRNGVSCAHRVTWPTQKVICPESLPPAKLVSFLLLIKHALPTATTCVYIIIYTILFYIKTWMTTINGCQSEKIQLTTSGKSEKYLIWTWHTYCWISTNNYKISQIHLRT